jgi:GMP synthase (glutamine-hydrolysing)
VSESPHSVVILQHESGAPAAILGDALREAGFRLDVRLLCSGDEVPGSLAGHDALIVLGGEMNVGDEADYPFLRAEQELLREAVRSGFPTLGICLGAQQLAASCGGGVVRRGALALGWYRFDVEREDALLAGVDPRTPVFHWREYACRLPDEAVLIASGNGDPQVFRLGSAAWGIQFHPEPNLEVLAGWFADDPQSVARGPGHGVDELLAESRQRLPASATLCRQVAANFLDATGLVVHH